MSNIMPLQSSYISRAFQTSVDLLVKAGNAATVSRNAHIIYNWVREKFSDQRIPTALADYSRNRGGIRIDILYDKEKSYFCIHIEHPDRDVPGRIWQIEAEIIVNDNVPRFGVKVSYYTPKNSNAIGMGNPIYSSPTFILPIARGQGFSDVRDLNRDVLLVNDNDKLEELFDLVSSTKRLFPVIAITEYEGINPSTGQISGTLVNPKDLLEKVGFIAHIVQLDKVYSQKWTELVGKEWGCYGGAVRTYYRNVDFEDTNYWRHPLAIAQSIRSSVYRDGDLEYTAADAFLHILVDRIKEYDRKLRIDWKERGHKFFFISSQERFALRNQDAQELLKGYKKQIQSYEMRIQELESDCLTEMEEKEQVEQELSQSKNNIYRQNALIDSLRKKLSEQGGKEDIPIPEDYLSMGNWIEQYFPGAIYLHPRATKSLKKATFEDVELVYRCVWLLATEYRKKRMGQENNFEAECNSLGIKDERAITNTRAGEEGDVYKIRYNGKPKLIERHLCKGTSRDPRECLRIYFFWDEENQICVLCDMPEHLPIRIS